MSVTAVRPPSSSAPPDKGIRPRRWTRREYHRAAELGLFRPEERLELLDGEIIQKMAPGGPHAAVVSRTDRILAGAFGPGYHTRIQQPLILTNWSEPEPDVVVVPGTEFDYLPITRRQQTLGWWSRFRTRRCVWIGAASRLPMLGPACGSTGSSTCCTAR